MKKFGKVLTSAAVAAGLMMACGAQAHGFWFAQRANSLAMVFGVGADDLDVLKRHAIGQRRGEGEQARVLARDVSLSLGPQADSSIGNQLPAVVEALADDEHPALTLVRVRLQPTSGTAALLVVGWRVIRQRRGARGPRP